MQETPCLFNSFKPNYTISNFKQQLSNILSTTLNTFPHTTTLKSKRSKIWQLYTEIKWKHCGKRKRLLVMRNFPCCHNVFESRQLQMRKHWSIWGNGLDFNCEHCYIYNMPILAYSFGQIHPFGRQRYRGRASATRTKGIGFESRDERLLPFDIVSTQTAQELVRFAGNRHRTWII